MVTYTPFVTASPRADVARATGWGLFIASLVLAGIYFGSRRLRDFDAALVPYAGASVFSAFGLGYRLLDVVDETAHAPLLAAPSYAGDAIGPRPTDFRPLGNMSWRSTRTDTRNANAHNVRFESRLAGGLGCLLAVQQPEHPNVVEGRLGKLADNRPDASCIVRPTHANGLSVCARAEHNLGLSGEGNVHEYLLSVPVGRTVASRLVHNRDTAGRARSLARGGSQLSACKLEEPVEIHR